MSTEVLFEKLAYPSLVAETVDGAADRASVRGYAAGYAAGARAAAADAALVATQNAALTQEALAETHAAAKLALSALNSAARHANAVARPVIAEADAALAAAALELAEVLLGKELEDHESSAKAALRRALGVAANDEILIVRMNPADIAILGDTAGALEAARLIGDPELLRGDAVLETPVGTIDARLSSAVERARAIIMGGAS